VTIHTRDCYPCKGTGFLVGWGAPPATVPCPAMDEDDHGDEEEEPEENGL
jgi:hypothetical protein